MEPLGAGDPRQLGEYRLLRRLGAGGMGRVYLGRSAGGRTVAVKVVREELAEDAEFRARFRREVEAARLVGGRWTAPVLDADTEGEQPWLATGYVAGPSLSTAVRDFGPLPAPAVHALGVGLAEGLAQVHRLGLVHRDVKPSNVLLALDGPRLIDFGIARALDATSTLTRSGVVVGSPGFMCPEQAAGEPMGAAGDVFSLGAVLAYAVSGVAPFGDAASAAVLLYRVLHEEPDLSGLEGELRVTVRHCLAKSPADRPTPEELRARLAGGAAALGADGWLPPRVSAAVARSAVELLDLEAEVVTVAVDAVPADGVPVDRTPTEVDRPKSPRRKRWWPVAAVAAAAAAALAGAVVWQLLPSGQGGGGTSQDGAKAAATDTLPASYVGTWQGTIQTKIVPLPSMFTIELGHGRVGEDVGHTRNASMLGDDAACKGIVKLDSVAADHIVLKERPDGQDPACTGVSETQTYTLENPKTLHLDVTGDALDMNPSGELSKTDRQ